MIPGWCRLIVTALTQTSWSFCPPMAHSSPPLFHLQLLVLFCYLTSLVHYTPSPNSLDEKTSGSTSATQLPHVRLAGNARGSHQNWRACPQFSSIVQTKWVKLGSSSSNIGTQSHGNDILVMANCSPWCVVIVWPMEATGSQDGVCMPSTIHAHMYKQVQTFYQTAAAQHHYTHFTALPLYL